MSKKNKNRNFQQSKSGDVVQGNSLSDLSKLLDQSQKVEVPEDLQGEKETVEEEELPEQVFAEDLRKALQHVDEVRRTYEKAKEQLQRQLSDIDGREKKLEDEKEEWRKERKEIAALKQEKEQSFRQERAKILEDAEVARKEVEEKSAAVEKAQSDLTAQQKAHALKVEDLEREKRMFAQKLQAAVADKEESLLLERQILEKRSETMSTYIERLTETEKALMEAKDRMRKLEQQSDFSSLEEKNATLLEENDCLRAELKQRPSTDLEPLYQETKRKNQQLEADNQNLRDENIRLNAQNQRMRLGVMEVENLREEKELWETKCKIHQQAVEEIKKDLNNYLNQQQGAMVFPSCKEMDDEVALNKAPEVSNDSLNLSEFAQDLRNHFAKKHERFYTPEDIRCFIAGMAASKLIILQGLSGTGKTTLPRIFSETIGADRDEKCIIPIQAGWRDRSDLIGHYNSFDKKFYETKFLKALYRSHTPCFAEKPYFIVLDEMNLSYAEQYFADIISLMEQKSKKLELITHTTATNKNVWPKHLIVDEGISIELPENVWFVGTANHDETTMDFADKTYDRAHIMELPSTAQSFSVSARINKDINELSYASLRDAFQNAEKKYENIAVNALKKLATHFKKLLNEKFGINWGNRLEKQAMSLLPVILACGGSEAEAMDHILSTKIIRKLKNRHDNTKEDLNSLLEIIKKEPFGGKMPKSVGMVNELLKNSL